MVVAYLGLGGNLGNPAAAIRHALLSLSNADGVQVLRISRFYKTKPVGVSSDQPDYINAAAAVSISLNPMELLDVCLSIERDIGRVRNERWGARVIDLDILLFDDRVICEPDLNVPHSMLRRRLFALAPLADIAPPGLELPPDGKLLTGLLRASMNDPEFSDQLPLIVVEEGIEITELTADNSSKELL